MATPRSFIYIRQQRLGDVLDIDPFHHRWLNGAQRTDFIYSTIAFPSNMFWKEKRERDELINIESINHTVRRNAYWIRISCVRWLSNLLSMPSFTSMLHLTEIATFKAAHEGSNLMTTPALVTMSTINDGTGMMCHDSLRHLISTN